jgi:hypothetical protein
MQSELVSIVSQHGFKLATGRTALEVQSFNISKLFSGHHSIKIGDYTFKRQGIAYVLQYEKPWYANPYTVGIVATPYTAIFVFVNDRSRSISHEDTNMLLEHKIELPTFVKLIKSKLNECRRLNYENMNHELLHLEKKESNHGQRS